MNISPTTARPTTATAPGMPGPDNPCIFPPRYTPSDVSSVFGNDLRQLGVSSVSQEHGGVVAHFQGPDAKVAQDVLRDVIGGVKLIVPQYRHFQPPTTMAQVAEMIGRLDAVRSVQFLDASGTLAVTTQDVASADRLRDLLDGRILGNEVTVDAALRFHPAI